MAFSKSHDDCNDLALPSPPAPTDAKGAPSVRRAFGVGVRAFGLAWGTESAEDCHQNKMRPLTILLQDRDHPL